MNKMLNPVGITIDTDMDADDLGQRLVDCVREISSDVNVVNIVKIHVGDKISPERISHVLEGLVTKPLREMGATNCIFVPLVPGFIEDIQIDHIEVIKDDGTNN